MFATVVTVTARPAQAEADQAEQNLGLWLVNLHVLAPTDTRFSCSLYLHSCSVMLKAQCRTVVFRGIDD